MRHFLSESRQPEAYADEHVAPRLWQRLVSAAPRVIRVIVAVAVALFFLDAPFASDDPLAMFVGLFPIAWIAVEFAWVALRPRAER
jgi:hypothetical protein